MRSFSISTCQDAAVPAGEPAARDGGERTGQSDWNGLRTGDRSGRRRPSCRDLTTDQRHKLRIVGTYTAPLGALGSLTVGGIQSFNSGNPYAAAENITIEPYVPAGLPYANAPAEVPNFFTEPDAFRTERAFSTDVSAHYRYQLPHAASFELFVKADVLNVFNNHAVINSQYLNLAVPTNVSAPDQYAAFNPFTETPARGVNWDLGPTFGEPSSRFAYQTPRTFRMSFGVRF